MAKDEESAGYLQNDLSLLLDGDITGEVAFFPSLYRRAIRFGHKDEVSELVPDRASGADPSGSYATSVVTYPDCVEGVVNQADYERGRLVLEVGELIWIALNCVSDCGIWAWRRWIMSIRGAICGAGELD